MIHSNPDLIASYLMQSRFIDSDGKLIDLSGNGHHGTITPGTGGFTVGPDGRRNTAYRFDGADTKIDTGSDIIGTQAVTISAWIHVSGNAENTSQRILDNGKFIFYYHRPTQKLWFSSTGSGNSNSTDNSILDNQWYHVAVTRTSAGVANFYINGILSGSANQNSGTPVAGTTNVIIGNNNAQTNTFDGFIANVEIYNAVYGQDWVSHQYKKFQQQIAVGKHLGLL